MNYVIFDLEWNQGNTGKHSAKHEQIPFEIIEIGAIKLDKHKNTIGQFNQLIKPGIYMNMHYITSNMMHIDMKELQYGKPFVEVINRFLEWCGEDYVFCTWGSLDLTELQRNMKYYKLPSITNGPIEYLDVQKLFSIAYEDNKSRRNLEYAIDFLNIEKDIPFHRAFSDAYYTAKILEKIPEDIEEYCSYDTYILPDKKQNEIHKIFANYSKYISREFQDKTYAIADREVLSTRCYICNKNAKRKIKWFSPNGKHYYSLSYCEQHGYLKGKIRIRKSAMNQSDDERVYVVKTLKLISEEDVADILLKKEHARIQRKIKRKQSKDNKVKTKNKN